MRKLNLVLLGVGLLFSLLLTSVGAFGACAPPASGDWVIGAADDCSVVNSQTVNGNLSVYGNLTLSGSNTVITINEPVSGLNKIYVDEGGRFNLTGQATLTSNGANKFYQLSVNESAIFWINNSTINNFEVGIVVKTSNFVIRDSTITGKGNGCISIGGGSPQSGGNITGNTLTCSGSNGHAIRLSSPSSVSNINITGNTLDAGNNKCVEIENSVNNIFLYKNSFKNCGIGIDIFKFSGNIFIGENNWVANGGGIQDNGGSDYIANNSFPIGLPLILNGVSYNNTFTTSAATVSGTSYNSTVTGSGQVNIGSSSTVYNWTISSSITGMTVSGSSSSIYNVTFKNNGKCGLEVSGSNNNIYENNFTGNTQCGINVTGTGNTIYNNYFSNNINAWSNANNYWNVTVQVKKNIMSGAYVGGNYWSDYNGADVTGDGLGDTDTPHTSGGLILLGGDYAPIAPTVYNGPVIFLVSPSNNTSTNNATPAFTFNITDIDSATTTATLYVNGTQKAQNVSAINKTLTTLNSTNLADGIYSWWVNVSDGSHEVQSEKRTIIISAADITAPATVTGLGETSKGENWILWNWTNPSDSDFNHVEVYLNGTFKTNTSGTSYNATGLTLNTGYGIQLHPVDNTGNIGSWTNDSAFTLDTQNTLPSIQIISPANNTQTNDNTPSITFKFIDNENSTAQVTLYFNGTNKSYNGNVANNTNTILTASVLADGNWSFWINVSDGAGENSSLRFDIGVDSTLPAIAIVAPTDINKSVSRNWTYYNITLDEAGNSANVEANGTNYSMSQGTTNNEWYKNFTNQNTGNYTYRFFANDTFGNTGFTGFSWVNISWSPIDTTPPAAITNLNESTKSTNSISWNWTNPTDSDFNHVEIYLNKTFKENTSSNSYQAASLSASTVYEVELRPVDNVGNIGSWTNDTAKTDDSPPPSNPGGGGGGGGGSSSSILNTTTNKEKQIAKKNETKTISQTNTQTAAVQPQASEQKIESEKTSNLNAQEAPSGFVVLNQLKNPYSIVLISGFLFAGMVGYAFYTGKVSLPKIRAPKIEKPKFAFMQKLKEVRLPNFSLPKVKIEPKPKAQSPPPIAKKIELPKITLPKFSLPKFKIEKRAQLQAESQVPQAEPQKQIIVQPKIFVKSPEIDYKKLAKELKPAVEQKQKAEKPQEEKKVDAAEQIPSPVFPALAKPYVVRPLQATAHMKTIMSALHEREREVIETLILHGGKSTMARVFHHTGMPPTTLFRWIVSLENRGLIKSTKIGKLRKLALTEKFVKGEQLVAS